MGQPGVITRFRFTGGLLLQDTESGAITNLAPAAHDGDYSYALYFFDGVDQVGSGAQLVSNAKSLKPSPEEMPSSPFPSLREIRGRRGRR